MTTATLTASPTRERVKLLEPGRTFLHPALDYLLIGGGLSFMVVAISWAFSGGVSADLAIGAMPIVILLSNSTHFAASTVRLYTKEDSFRAFPFHTMMFPIVTLGVASLAIAFPEQLGRNLTAIFLAWSPYHYSAQAYGLAVMYCYRSGTKLSNGQKWLLWLACMVTFAKTMIASPERSLGLWWLVPWDGVSSAWPAAVDVLQGMTSTLAVLAVALPIALYAWVLRSTKNAMPAISILLVATNALWFFAFKYFAALTWATVFHGIQYLMIVTIFHVKDQLRKPGNRRGALFHSLWFYGVSLAIGYLLFQGWPCIYTMLGFGFVESSMLVAAVINLHHFIVDRVIWRLRKDPNFRTVSGAAPGLT